MWGGQLVPVNQYFRVHGIQATGICLMWIAWNSGNSFFGMRRVLKQKQTLRHPPPLHPPLSLIASIPPRGHIWEPGEGASEEGFEVGS